MNEPLIVTQHRRKYTLMAIGYGAIILAWLTPEDSTVLIVSILGAGLSLMILLLAVMRWFGGRSLAPRQWIPGMVIFGALVGFGAVWTTIFLMIFKNAWHSHAALDFPGEVVVAMVDRAIPWTLAGALLGGATAFLRAGRIRPESRQSPEL